eukprot:m.287786 g.287786  ORF g.287786 m.287786 type:complete len:152 (+) comp16366_c0_seq2:503-958(+)
MGHVQNPSSMTGTGERCRSTNQGSEILQKILCEHWLDATVVDVLFGCRNLEDLRRLAKHQQWELESEIMQYDCPGIKPTTKGIIVSTDYVGPFERGLGGYTGFFMHTFNQYKLDAGLQAGNLSMGQQLAAVGTKWRASPHSKPACECGGQI